MQKGTRTWIRYHPLFGFLEFHHVRLLSTLPFSVGSTFPDERSHNRNLPRVPFLLGPVFLLFGPQNGEASLITPIMGSKPIFVALFLMVHGLSTEQVTWEIWLASAMAALAIALLCWPSKDTKTSWVALVLALATAATFGLLDSLVPHFTHQSSPLNVLFFVFGSVGIYSLCLIPYTEGRFIPRRENADSWMWISAFFMGGQAVLMSIAIGFYEVPTAANVFYACRGLWAVLLIAWLGKKMQINESDSSHQP